MANVTGVRVAVPKAYASEIARRDLVPEILGTRKRFVYVHAGAGYGKTTLLSQAANAKKNVVWLTLDGESDVFSFLGALCEAVRHAFPEYGFNISEYLPFEEKGNFITILSNALLSSVEQLEKEATIILDDVHTLKDPRIRQLVACAIKYKPENVRFWLSSREAPWQELIPLRVRGDCLEITSKRLAFTRKEIAEIMGFDDAYIFEITEGWPLAIGSFRVLLENGASMEDIPTQGKKSLYSYLFYECISRLTPEMVNFLKSSACFEELDHQMLDSVLCMRNTRLLLESLVARNIFTIKTDGGYYRYHALFRDYLMEYSEAGRGAELQGKAACYYLERKQYSKAAEYAIKAADRPALERVILATYREYIGTGRFSELRLWFGALGGEPESREVLVAKSAYLSSVGNFTEAQACLDKAIPLISKEDRELYFEAVLHKARVMRNYVSFEASNRVLDELIEQLDEPAGEQAYWIFIEKIFNLCWDSRISEALELTWHMIDLCSSFGNVRVRMWYERYLSVINYVAGRMKDSVHYYEKSLSIPEQERRCLERHSIDVYVAKAYQMLGEREKAISLVTEGMRKLRNAGRYEELWLGYLFAAEISYQNASIDKMNGSSGSFETTVKYFSLADEYAPLYRKSEFQKNWAKLQRNICELMFMTGNKENVIREIFLNIPNTGDHFKTIAYGRLFNYFGSIQDYENAAACARAAIEIGERANTMMVATMAYGFLARIALANGNTEEASRLVGRFLLLCDENGIYEYFRMRTAYDPILAFAAENGIEPKITGQIMRFAGFKTKRAYVATLGGFAVFPYSERIEPVKTRTRKERELLAFLLDAGAEGVTKEQIHDALWFESDSNDVKKLIGVNLAQIKKDLAALGIESPIINRKQHYSIDREEIVTDTDLFVEAVRECGDKKSAEAARRALSLYRGEYLSGYEALWASGRRALYASLWEEAKKCASRCIPSTMEQ